MGHTAIDWLKNKLKETYDKEGKLPLAYTLYLVEQAKEIEKKQIIEAAKINLWCAIGDGSDQAEEYYNETYGGQGSPDTITSPTK